VLLRDELRDAWRSEDREHRLALVSIAVIALVLRALHLGQPIRHDEAVTWLEFARYPIADALARYHDPNNHVLHTLLVKASAGIFGSDPWALRVPAFLAGIAVVPATYAGARVLYGSRAALFAAALVAASGALTLYSANARGYSMVVLAFLLLVLTGARLIAAPSLRLWAAFAVIAALGAWTIPVMIFPLGAVSLWLALTFALAGRRTDVGRLAATLAVVAAMVALAYAPVASRAGFGTLVRNRLATSSAWPTFLSDLATTGWQAIGSWGLGLPPLITALVVACAAWALARHASLSRLPVGLPVAAFVWCAWLLVISHHAPFPRVWLWLLPLGAALAGAGATDLLSRWRASRAQFDRRAPLIAVLFALGAAASVSLSGAVRLTNDTGIFVEAPEVAAALKAILRPGDRVVAPVPSNGPLAFHMDKLGVDPGYLTLDEAAAERLIIVVDASSGLTLESILRSTAARDTARFAGSIVAQYERTMLVMFARKHVAPR